MNEENLRWWPNAVRSLIDVLQMIQSPEAVAWLKEGDPTKVDAQELFNMVDDFYDMLRPRAEYPDTPPLPVELEDALRRFYKKLGDAVGKYKNDAQLIEDPIWHEIQSDASSVEQMLSAALSLAVSD